MLFTLRTNVNMFRPKFAVLAPVVLLLLILKGEAANETTTVPNNSTTGAPSNLTTVPTVTQGNASIMHPSAKTTPQRYHEPVQFGGMLKRLVYVTLILSAVIGLYFLGKFCCSRRRKPRKYGVVKTPGDMEMRPLESDDEDDEDVTMFNRKN